MTVNKAFFNTLIADPTGESQMKAFPTEMKNYGSGGALVKNQYSKLGPAGTMVYFQCDDCAIEASRVPLNGGKVIRPKFSIGEFGFVAICEDTEGNLIGLSSMK